MASRVPVTSERSTASAPRPFDPFVALRQQMDRLFDDFFRWPNTAGAAEPAMLRPRMDVSETEQGIEVVADLPGVDAKDLDVRIDGDMLRIRAEAKAEQEEKGRTYHIMERSYGMFARTLALPFEPDPAKVEASFENGVLRIMLPRPAEAQQRARRIEVKAKGA
ncbi:MAG TPA: Hsp20/alpha crystallin family protein [Alphaproteobacteria bacterium]